MGKFALDIARFAAKVPERTKQVVDKVALDLLTGIVFRSPVGNPKLWKGYPPRRPPAGYVGGRLRGNWNVGLGTTNTAARAPDKSGNAAKRRGQATIAARAVDVDIYITNSLPYAERIEFGYSTQAPAGMLRVTVTEFQTFINKAVATP